jgi:hypothetical protein
MHPSTTIVKEKGMSRKYMIGTRMALEVRASCCCTSLYYRMIGRRSTFMNETRNGISVHLGEKDAAFSILCTRTNWALGGKRLISPEARRPVPPVIK